MLLTSTIAEAFQHGAHIANPALDLDEQLVTLDDGRVWMLTDAEWHQMFLAVNAVSMFLSTVCGQAPRNPLPSAEAMRHFMPYGHGGPFWLTAEGRNAKNMSATTLEYWVRHMAEYAFLDGTSIADASSHSNAELWSDVIIPAIERGEIQTSVWGQPL